jgi:hypothetical protein
MRRPNIVRPVKLTINLPEDVASKLALFLFSELEGRIPHGAYQKFFVERINEFFLTHNIPEHPNVTLKP